MKYLIVTAKRNYIHTFGTWLFIFLVMVLYPSLLIFNISVDAFYIKVSVVFAVLSSMIVVFGSHYTKSGYLFIRNGELNIETSDKKSYMCQGTENLRLTIYGYQGQLLKGKFMFRLHDGLKNRLEVGNKTFEILLRGKSERDNLVKEMKDIDVDISLNS